jgi:hypothetical protein
MDQGALIIEDDNSLAEPVEYLDPPATQRIPIILFHAWLTVRAVGFIRG